MVLIYQSMQVDKTGTHINYSPCKVATCIVPFVSAGDFSIKGSTKSSFDNRLCLSYARINEAVNVKDYMPRKL